MNEDISYQLVRSYRKTLAIEVTRNGSVIVRAPNHLSEERIIQFVKSKYKWLQNALARQRQVTDFYTRTNKEIEQLKYSAREWIPKRVEFYAKQMGLQPSVVRINVARTRFGSCGPKNSLNFSAYLMLFPKEAVDYVVVHELAHMRHRNHQKEFYRLVESILPDYKKRAAQLKIQTYSE